MSAVRLALPLTVAVIVAAAVGLARPSEAFAQWCWPSDCSFGYLSVTTSTNNGCWYSSGEVCSGWNYWNSQHFYRNQALYYRASVLYGYENSERIRGRIHDWDDPVCWPCVVTPSHLGMGGYLRTHNTWWGNGDYAHVGPIAFAG